MESKFDFKLKYLKTKCYTHRVYKDRLVPRLFKASLKEHKHIYISKWIRTMVKSIICS